MRNLLPVRERRRLVALLGAVLAVLSTAVLAGPPEPVPAGFVRQDLKEVRASILRPQKWLWRLTLPIPGCPFFDLSPQPFEDLYGVKKGVGIHVLAKTGKTADETAVAMINILAAQPGMVRGWTRRDTPSAPFTTYGLISIVQNEETEGVRTTCEVIYVANRATDTVYQCWLVAPSAEWQDVESVGEVMLASLRPDPEF